MSEPPRHNDVLKTDVERVQMLVRLGQVITPEEHRILFQEGLSNDDKLAAIARDPQKAQLYNKLLLRHHENLLLNKVDYQPSRYSRSVSQPLTWYNDKKLGIFVLPSNMVPTSPCDSLREIIRIDKAKYFQSEKAHSFSNIVTFQEPNSGTGLAVLLQNKKQSFAIIISSAYNVMTFIYFFPTPQTPTCPSQEPRTDFSARPSSPTRRLCQSQHQRP